MSNTTYYVNSEDATSIESLIDAFEARDTTHEDAIRRVLALHERAFTVRLDFVSRPTLTPLDDAFTFDTMTDELVVYSNDPAVLVDAILEMAMYMRGFNTTLGSFDEWKTQFTIGAWRHVRRNLKEQLGFDTSTVWHFPLEIDAVDRFNPRSFESMIFLAGRSDGDVAFPPGANAIVVEAYQRLRRIMHTLAFEITLDHFQTFNRRLASALRWVEESIMPGEASPFDDLFGPGGIDDRFFSEGLDD
jgi:hypothetical protein